MNKKCNICHAMKTLEKEQKILTSIGVDFQFLCMSEKYDTIPFMLHNNEKNKPFMAHHKCIATPFFRLEKLDEELCCAELSLLEAIDMEGNPADSVEDLFALRKTKSCIIVNLCCFCVINPFPPELVNRALPIIEPKK